MAGSPRRAGAAIQHPAVLVSIVVLVLNDHWGKQAFPGWFTGKLSDFAGLVFFPVLVFCAVEVAAWAARRPPPGRGWAIGVCLGVAVAFAAVKTSELANRAYELALEWLRWLPSATRAVLASGTPPPATPVEIVRDPTDALALAAVWLAWLILARAIGPHARPIAGPLASDRGWTP